MASLDAGAEESLGFGDNTLYLAILRNCLFDSNYKDIWGGLFTFTYQISGNIKTDM